MGTTDLVINRIPYAGSVEAVAFGCICEPGANMRAATDHRMPVYHHLCPVHIWVCQYDGRCNQHQIEHVGEHEKCEHCTTPNWNCSKCLKVWTDWRVRPESAGWVRINSEMWLCSDCSSSVFDH